MVTVLTMQVAKRRDTLKGPVYSLANISTTHVLLPLLIATSRRRQAGADGIPGKEWTARKLYVVCRKGEGFTIEPCPRFAGKPAKQNGELLCLPWWCTAHTMPRTCLVAMQPCPVGGLGHALCVAPFRMGCPFQAERSMSFAEQSQRDIRSSVNGVLQLAYRSAYPEEKQRVENIFSQCLLLIDDGQLSLRRCPCMEEIDSGPIYFRVR